MATHSSVRAWRIPGTGEPGGLPSMGRTESDTTEVTQQQQPLRINCWSDFYQTSLVAQTVKNPPVNEGDLGLIPGSGISPGEGNGNPLQYSCLANPMDGGAWRATVQRITKNLNTT